MSRWPKWTRSRIIHGRQPDPKVRILFRTKSHIILLSNVISHQIKYSIIDAAVEEKQDDTEPFSQCLREAFKNESFPSTFNFKHTKIGDRFQEKFGSNLFAPKVTPMKLYLPFYCSTYNPLILLSSEKFWTEKGPGWGTRNQKAYDRSLIKCDYSPIHQRRKHPTLCDVLPQNCSSHSGLPCTFLSWLTGSSSLDLSSHSTTLVSNSWSLMLSFHVIATSVDLCHKTSTAF